MLYTMNGTEAAPEEEAAYKEKFPVCEYVYTLNFKDGSGGRTHCAIRHAVGKPGQLPLDDRICADCLSCTDFTERTTERKSFTWPDNLKFENDLQRQLHPPPPPEPKPKAEKTVKKKATKTTTKKKPKK